MDYPRISCKNNYQGYIMLTSSSYVKSLLRNWSSLLWAHIIGLYKAHYSLIFLFALPLKKLRAMFELNDLASYVTNISWHDPISLLMRELWSGILHWSVQQFCSPNVSLISDTCLGQTLTLLCFHFSTNKNTRIWCPISYYYLHFSDISIQD